MPAFLDVAEAWKQDQGRTWREMGPDLPGYLPGKGEEPVFKPWIITNAKFTEDAVRYSQCAAYSPDGLGLSRAPLRCSRSLEEGTAHAG